MQLKINGYYDKIFEWIPYDQFDNTKEISKNDSITIYSAIWKNGRLNHDTYKKIYKRNSKNQNKKVSLKCYSIQDIIDFFNEVQKLLYKFYLIYFLIILLFLF